MAALYDDLEFRTPLEAHWAAFFDLAGWVWQCNPAAIRDWKPDFRVKFACRHSESNGSHTLLVSIVPGADPEKLRGHHPATRFPYGMSDDDQPIRADASALFGSDPGATSWEMTHGAGGGPYSVPDWADNATALWGKAAQLVR